MKKKEQLKLFGQDAYGNVKTVKLLMVRLLLKLSSTPLFVERSIGKVYDGNVYRIQVKVTFTDDTVEEKELVLNLSGEDIEDPEKPEKPNHNLLVVNWVQALLQSSDW